MEDPEIHLNIVDGLETTLKDEYPFSIELSCNGWPMIYNVEKKHYSKEKDTEA